MRILLRPLAMFACAMLFSLTVSGASTKTWREHRDMARGAARQNNFDEALRLYSLAFREAEAAFKGTDLRYLETASDAGQIHIQLRKFEPAIEIYSKALARLEKPKGDEKIYKAAFLNALAGAYMYAQKLDLAEETYRSAARYTEEKIGQYHPLLAESLEGLGAVQLERKQPEEALITLEKALFVAVAHRRNPLPTESSIQNTIGIVHLTQSNYVQAEKSFRDALKTINRRQGDNSVNTASYLKNLSTAYHGQRKYQDAEDTLIRLIVRGEKSPGSALTLGQAALHLAELHYEQNDAALDRLFERMLSGKSDEPHPKNFFSYLSVMAGSYARKDWPRTHALLEKAKRHAEEGAAQISNFGATLARHQKQPEDAIAFLRQCLIELTKSHGAKSAALAEPTKTLAELYAEQGNEVEAERLYEELVAITRSAFGEKDSRVANAMDDQAGYLERAGKKEKASEIRAESNRVRAAALLNP